MVLFFMTLYLIDHLSYSTELASTMISIYGLGSVAGSYLGGWLADRIGTKNVQLMSLAGSGIGYIVISFLATPLMFGIALFTLALIAESLRPANTMAIAEACPPELVSRGFGLHRLAINLGVSIGPAVGGLLIAYNYSLLFWVDGVTCLVAVVILWALFPAFKPKLRTGEMPAAPALSGPLKDRQFLLMLGLSFIAGLVFFQLFTTWPLYLKNVQLMDEGQIGSLLALNSLFIVLVEMPLLHRLEKNNVYKILAIGVLLQFGGFAIMPLGNGMSFIVLTVVVWTIGEMLVFPILTTAIAGMTTDENRGRYMGLFTLSFALAFVAAPKWGAAIYLSLGPDWLWLACGLLGILSSIGFLLLNPERRIIKPETEK